MQEPKPNAGAALDHRRSESPWSSDSSGVETPPIPPTELDLLAQLERPLVLRRERGRVQASPYSMGDALPIERGGFGWVPKIGAEDLGDPGFCRMHGTRLAYVVGAMANGITSVEMTVATGNAGILAIFGAAGLRVDQVESAFQTIAGQLRPWSPWGVNLIYTPHERSWESAVADLCIRYQVPTVSASAYLDLSPEIVRLRASGLEIGSNGAIRSPRRVVAKVSRIELAEKFIRPAPEKILRALVESKKISASEAELAARLPVVDDLTIEADSGGHTDNRPSFAQFPAMVALRDRLQREYGASHFVRLGAAGGLGSPVAIAAAFAMGAAYVVTGSINQACVESGSSAAVRSMLAQAGQADVMMAPAADMFEMGVKLQVLKRGTMFAMRAQKLYDFYREYPSYESIPTEDRVWIEEKIFQSGVGAIWQETQSYWARRDRRQLERAAREPKHKMALLFRWYLGQASRWANRGEPTRRGDYQIWCGPAMGAFNEWARGTAFGDAGARKVVDVAHALMEQAAFWSRVHIARLQGLDIPTHEITDSKASRVKAYSV